METKKKLFLVDAYALIFRGYYAFIKNPRINSKGVDTSAIMGFTNSLFDVIKREKPDYIAVCFDKGGSHDRTKIFKEYKANRDETPEAIKIAVPYIEKILKSLNIAIVVKEGYEADDIIGTIAKKVKQKNLKTYMVTPDKDFAQLVEKDIYMYRPVFGGGYETWGIDEVLKKFEIDKTSQVIDFLAMKGDSVDNIPGLPGVGDKTAKKFISEFGSLEGLFENTDQLKGKIKEKVEQNKELGILSKKLATIITDVPLSFKIEDFKLNVSELEETKNLFDDLEFRRLSNSLNSIFSNFQETVEKKINSKNNGQFDLFADTERETISKKNNLIIQKVQDGISYVLFEKKMREKKTVSYTLHKSDQNELIGISICWQKDIVYQINLTSKINLNFIESFFSNDCEKISYDLKSDIKLLLQNKISVKSKVFDVQLSHYLINADASHNLINLSKKYLNIQLDKNSNELENSEISDLIFQLHKPLYADLMKKNQLGLYEKIEIPLLKVLASMEIEGINLDTKFLNNLSAKTNQKLIKIQKDIFEISGEEFNISSPKQLGEVLFEKMKVSKNPKKTKTGQYSTAEDILSNLAKDNDFVKLILKFRSVSKLLNTYIDSLPKQISKSTNRIHTNFLQTVAATGRLSSVNPNLQNIPIRTDSGKEIRKAFVPRNKDFFLMAADYSQIELRVIAALSKEDNMIRSFEKNEDIHLSTAATVFNIPLEKVTKQQRSHAKIVNFGIIYGVSAFGLSNQTDLNIKESKSLIETYYLKYPKLKQFIENQISFARDKGYVETILGRRRILRDINSTNSVVRSAAERNAVNAPIQGSAADIIKISMINIQKEFVSKKIKSKMLLQIHDELVFDVFKPELNKVMEIVRYQMENAFKLDIPLSVDIDYGVNWLEAH
ncbi:MAG: DNA polymerase I [Bacteroidetes bacterium MED-G13]|nr:MAG: DNA polymerase I [Bacteroidetes bacterium MED-G13]